MLRTVTAGRCNERLSCVCSEDNAAAIATSLLEVWHRGKQWICSIFCAKSRLKDHTIIYVAGHLSHTPYK